MSKDKGNPLDNIRLKLGDDLFGTFSKPTMKPVGNAITADEVKRAIAAAMPPRSLLKADQPKFEHGDVALVQYMTTHGARCFVTADLNEVIRQCKEFEDEGRAYQIFRIRSRDLKIKP